MRFVPISARDGSWKTLIENWQQQCAHFHEDFDSYELAVMPVVKALAEGPEERNAGIFGLVNDQESGDQEYIAVCQLNAAYISGYTGRVLRVRHIVLSPRYDYGEYGAEKYNEILGSLFVGIVNVSDSTLSSDHIKIHLKSPNDRSVFSAIGAALRGSTAFKSVVSHGSWLYITK